MPGIRALAQELAVPVANQRASVQGEVGAAGHGGPFGLRGTRT
ncbi:MAG: hypothetical protein QN177_11350 [Armatimonadota bacterium]|nr:hypothetical protein [Armatimonadota bacterium]MDR7526036.1 hypothetical protein [Armatimonadota bacterium]MDR7566530.1 hypothetical protein [Armatimonadota bacterium]